MNTYPLLDSQLGILLACSRYPASTAWNLPSVIVFDKTISADRLAAAMRKICTTRMELHVQFLRTKEGTLRQYADATLDIPVVLSKMTDSEAELYMKRDFVRPFSLFSHQSLCRFEVVETEKRVLLLCDFHHSIADGFTIARQLIGTDLPTAYLDQTLMMPAMTLFDWSQHECQEMDTAAYVRARDYYQALFCDVEISRLSLKESHDMGKAIMERFSLRMSDVDEWCAAHHSSAFHFLMSAFCLALSKLSHQKKVVFCTLNHGRYDKKLSDAYGMFVNTIPFVIDIEPEKSVSMLMAQVRKRLMDNQRHRTYPFTHFCSDMGVVPKITFGFQSNGILEQTVIDGQRFEGIQLPRHDSQSDLSVMVYTNGDEYDVRVEASDTLYEGADLKRFCDAMLHCIGELMLHENRPVGEIQLINHSQRKQILQLSAGEQTEDDQALTVIGMFLRQTMATPDAMAVTDGACAMTYREVEHQSRVLANRWIAEGMKKGELVGVDTTPCCEFLVAVLAIMRAGGAYVPIDSHLPPKRREHIINDAQIQIIADAAYVREYATLDAPGLPIDLSESSGMAYMIYTSGTTGMPKGVVIRHAGLSNLIRFCVRRWPLNCHSRIACQSTLAFDASVEDLFPVLSVGGCVVMVPEGVRTDLNELALFVQRQRVTGGCLTTRLGVALAASHTLNVDYLCLGGERLMSVPQIQGKVYNTYGPTEFTVDATYCELEKDKVYDSIPIGRPLDNCHAFVVDPYGCLLPQGAVGELWLAGPQIAAGYWHAPQITEERFTACSFYGATVYHTGDLVRWNSEGLLEYVGRLDNLVKIDGMRISLEEIEQQLLALPGVDNAAVVSEDVNGRLQIQAFFTSGDNVSSGTLQKRLRESLPLQMIPRQLVRLERMPLMPNGKVDRRHLHIDLLPMDDSTPADASETTLCILMAHVLGLQQVGPAEDFFALGGTSLTAMQLVAEARKKGVTLAYADIFSYPTAQLLSQCIKSKNEDHAFDISYFDDEDIRQLLEQGTDSKGEAYPGGTVLLTGATGFLGIHVLARFLASNAWKVICLVRAKDEQEAWERLNDRWTFYFGHTSFDKNKVGVVCGDLTQPSSLCGVKDVSFDILVNCAADVRYFAKDNNIVEVNVKGAVYMAQLCMETGARLIQISTLSVAGVGSTGGMAQISPHQLYIGQRLLDQYSYSKFMAEREILQRVVSERLKANIIRVGHIAPRSTDGKAQVNTSENMLSSMLKVMVEVGACPLSATELEVVWTPVDDIAAFVFNGVTEGFAQTIMHVKGKEPYCLKTLADIHAGVQLPLWSDDDFRNRLLGLRKENIGVHLLASFLIR